MNDYDKYYNTLNLSKEATLNDIKKAYRQLSIKHHPDKNNNCDNEQFNKINDAYTQLTNNFDTIHEKINNNHNHNHNSLINNIHNNHNNLNHNNLNHNNLNHNNLNHNNLNHNNHSLMNNHTLMSNHCFNDDYYNHNIKNYEDIIHNLNINYAEAYYGCNKPIIVERNITINNIISHEKETLYIQIPKGIDNNEIIILQNKGNLYINNGQNNYSNIKIIICLNKYEKFERNGLDLIYIKTISLKEALIGFNFTLNHINNKNYKITSYEVVNLNYEKIIKDLGFMREAFIGNLVIKFDIVFPTIISPETKKLLQNVEI